MTLKLSAVSACRALGTFRSPEEQALLAAARAELARRDFLEFCKQLDGRFETPAHIQHIAQLLTQVESGDIRRLLICLPPRHGKSRILQFFAGWFMGRHPERHVITASHSAELSERNSRASRALVADDRWPFAARLSRDTQAQNRWSLDPDGGTLLATGVLGSITGHGADLLVLDDIEHDERSSAERKATWEWYSQIASPRLEPRGRIVSICTRWAEDDVAGRMLAGDDGAKWVACILPAFAVERDRLGRAIGEALWAERFSAAELVSRKHAMGSRAFSAQFGQEPLPLEGSIIKSAWLRRWENLPRDFDNTVMALDAAAKTGISNDFSAIVVLGITESQFYVLDVWRQRVEYPDLLRAVVSKFAQHRPSAIYVEDTSNATALIQQLKRESHLPVVAVPIRGSKISRVESITGLLEAGKVLLPTEEPWLADFEVELLRFPYGKNDDQVDAFTLAVSKAQNAPNPFFFLKLSTRMSPLRIYDNYGLCTLP